MRFPWIFIYIYIFFKFISSRIKKKTEAESKDCHAKNYVEFGKADTAYLYAKHPTCIYSIKYILKVSLFAADLKKGESRINIFSTFFFLLKEPA